MGGAAYFEKYVMKLSSDDASLILGTPNGLLAWKFDAPCMELKYSASIRPTFAHAFIRDHWLYYHSDRLKREVRILHLPAEYSQWHTHVHHSGQRIVVSSKGNAVIIIDISSLDL